MSNVKHDVPLKDLQKVGNEVGADARRKAFDAGSSVTYASGGKLIRESSSGKFEELGDSSARDVTVRKLVWKRR